MIKLNENIKKYRQQKNMTQSQLADVFNVSEQAISRWENGNTYPDITLLPAIADYFHVTIDELMGMESYKDEREIEKVFEQCRENDRKGHVHKSVKLLKEAAKKYPTNFTILMHLVKELNFEYTDDNAKEHDNCEMVIDIASRVLNECTDRQICNSVINEKIIALRKLGRIDEAIEISKEQPTIWETSSFRLIELLSGEELKIHCKNTVMQFVLATYSTMVKLADLDFANDNMTIQERIDVVKKILELLDLIYEDNYGYESRLVAWMHRAIAAMEVLEGNTEATLEHLEQAAKYSIIHDTLPDRFTLDSTLLSGIECKDHYRNFDWTECTEFNEKLRQGRYDIVRNTDRFKAVEKEITPYVVTKN